MTENLKADYISNLNYLWHFQFELMETQIDNIIYMWWCLKILMGQRTFGFVTHEKANIK